MFGSRRSVAAAVALAVAGTLAAAPATALAQHDQSVVSAYFAGWDVYGRGYHVKGIPADKINVIQYAFAAPTFDKATGAVGCSVLDPWADYQQPYPADLAVGGVADDAADANQHLYGNFNQLRRLKAAHPGLRVEISVGGWTKSTWFSSVAADANRRKQFVQSCVDTFIKGDLPGGGWPASAGGPGAATGLFDGIDVDWEYPTQVAGGNVDPSPADRHNATELFTEFRRQLEAQGARDHRHYLLTAALPATSKAGQYYELPQAIAQLDWANLMTYDYNVPGGGIAAPDTLLRPDPRDPNAKDLTGNTIGTVAYYLGRGVPANKIVVGVPFYGNQYLRTGGLYQKADNSGLDPNSLAWDAKPQPTYHDLVDTAHVVGANGFSQHWNAFAGEPWLYNPAQSHNLCGQFNADGSCASPY
ncbi:glycoside hydrolase family 18 protein [Kutzneria albida]|uniref:chitinase n=1 Tax=Kutzneria albida DSM 43870 TaxID=1449976 RepID=W5W5N9_9PSEU|nr:glycosyl hydrolase family 18 protein [Kutzneria albida]AHH96085.1 putative secreted protein [Kutzneria albida DSM 43870]